MLFHEYAITPSVFDKAYIEQDISLQIYLKFFLTNLRKNGLLANLNRSEWLREVNRYRENLSPKLKDDISKLFEELGKRNRIVEHQTITDSSIVDENGWIDLLIREDEIKPYHAMIFTGKIEEKHKKMSTLEKFMNDGLISDNEAPLLYQTLENMEKYLEDFLAYAKRLVVIDPYFTYNKDDDKVLLLFSELFAKRRGNRMKNKQFILHVFYNKRDRNVDPDSVVYQMKWSKLFETIYHKFGHNVRLNVWNIRELHDRYMLTDQGGISSSNGFGVFRNRKPHWSILTNNEIREQLNYFLPNANPSLRGALKYSITKESYKTLIPEPITKIGLQGTIASIEDIERGKRGVIKDDNDEYVFTLSKLNKLSREIQPGMLVEFRLVITDEEKKVNILKILP